MNLSTILKFTPSSGETFISSETITSGSFTIPSGTDKIVISFQSEASVAKLAGEVVLYPNIKTSGKLLFTGIDGVNVSGGITFTISGSSITTSFVDGDGRLSSWTATAYYFSI